MKILITVCVIACTFPELFAQTAETDSVVIDVSNASLNQDAPSVSINRKNNDLIVIGAASDNTDMDLNGISAYTSTDTGRTWNLFRLPLPTDQLYIYGEASVTCDNSGNFYYAYITDDGVDSAGSIVIAASTDGKIWNNATPIDNNIPPNYGNPDGVFLTVDNSSSSIHNGRVYAVWTQYYQADTAFESEGAYISWSDNKCVTWSKPKFLGASDDYLVARTGKNGEIYVTLSDSLGLGDQLMVSTDGGATFTNPYFLLFNSYPFFTSGLDAGYTGLKGSQGFAAFPYPSIDIDLNSNKIYGIFGDYQSGVATLTYGFSEDNGVTWSTPQIIGINTPDSADRFDAWVSVDQKTGAAYVLYYSSESDPNNILTAPYRLQLTDVLPDKPEMLSPSFNPLIVEKSATNPPYIGDHTSSDAFAGIYVGAWTQNRAGLTDGDVFAFVSLPSVKNSVETPVVVHSQQIWLSSPYPNPCQGKSISVSYFVPHATHIIFDLYEESGRPVRHLGDKTVEEGSFTDDFDIGSLPAGTYILHMTTLDGIASQKFIRIGQ